MNRALLIGLLAAGLTSAQTNSADRNATIASTPNHGLWKVLRQIEPAEDKPLTTKQRFHNYVRSVAGPLPVLGEAASAAISQAIGSPPEWGGGMEGYAKRLGNNLAYNGIRQTITFGAESVFHEDNRYFASTQNSVKGRVAHALISPLVARRTSGRYSISISGLGGITGAALLSQTWAPRSWRGPGNVMESIGLTIAGTAGLNLVREFMPDVVRHFRK